MSEFENIQQPLPLPKFLAPFLGTATGTLSPGKITPILSCDAFYTLGQGRIFRNG